MSEKDSKYLSRGVSASKGDIHNAIKHIEGGIFPNAFCKILPDIFSDDPEKCIALHADTAGTKGSLAYIYWRETDDLSVWEGIAQDALVMNLDDMACSGFTDKFIVSSTIGRNRNLIPAAAIERIIYWLPKFSKKMAEYGIELVSAGGETADVGDIVRTIDVGYTLMSVMDRNKVIENNIQAGDMIVGLASYGKSTYEECYNGGMGSNGLTSARHDVFVKKYAKKYPESYDSAIPKKLIYAGSKKVDESVFIDSEPITIGKLVLSPTRTFLPVIKKVLDDHRGEVHGIIHNTGGAHTLKVLRFAHGLKVIKDNLLPIPPLFQMIQKE